MNEYKEQPMFSDGEHERIDHIAEYYREWRDRVLENISELSEEEKEKIITDIKQVKTKDLNPNLKEVNPEELHDYDLHIWQKIRDFLSNEENKNNDHEKERIRSVFEEYRQNIRNELLKNDNNIYLSGYFYEALLKFSLDIFH